MKGTVIGALISGIIHFTILSLPISQNPSIVPREMPKPIELSLVIHRDTKRVKTPLKAIKKGGTKKIPVRQRIEAPGLAAEAYVRKPLPMAEAHVRVPHIGKVDDVQQHRLERRANPTLAIPRYLINPKPSYPEVARRKGYEGTVRLEVEVLPDGMVGGIKVKESSGYEVLDRCALDTVKGWSFSYGVELLT